LKTFDEIKRAVNQFAAERAWKKFHSPKNLAMALTVEAGELMENFQWLTEQQSDELSNEKLIAVGEEIADVQIYLVMLADRLGIDLGDVVTRKLEKNAGRYTVERSYGNAKKYTGLDESS
jgi:dCTP diphosphatase